MPRNRAPLRATRPRLRRPPSFDHVAYTRRVKGVDKVQLRWWLPPRNSIHLGIYHRDAIALVRRHLIRETQNHPCTMLGVWGAIRVVLDALRRTGVKVPTVWPMYVRRNRDGSGGFSARARFGKAPHKVLIELPGPFDAPEDAHSAFVRHLVGLGLLPASLLPSAPVPSELMMAGG